MAGDQSDCAQREREQKIGEQQKNKEMQGSNITRIIGALEGFVESSLFLEKQHLNIIAESILLKGVCTVLVLVAAVLTLRRRGVRRHRKTRKRGFSTQRDVL